MCKNKYSDLHTMKRVPWRKTAYRTLMVIDMDLNQCIGIYTIDTSFDISMDIGILIWMTKKITKYMLWLLLCKKLANC